MEEDGLCRSIGGGEDVVVEKRELRHLFVTVFLSSFATFLVFPAITDITIAALCPVRSRVGHLSFPPSNLWNCSSPDTANDAYTFLEFNTQGEDFDYPEFPSSNTDTKDPLFF